jgi:hypothetical protein
VIGDWGIGGLGIGDWGAESEERRAKSGVWVFGCLGVWVFGCLPLAMPVSGFAGMGPSEASPQTQDCKTQDARPRN